MPEQIRLKVRVLTQLCSDAASCSRLFLSLKDDQSVSLACLRCIFFP